MRPATRVGCDSTTRRTIVQLLLSRPSVLTAASMHLNVAIQPCHTTAAVRFHGRLGSIRRQLGSFLMTLLKVDSQNTLHSSPVLPLLISQQLQPRNHFGSAMEPYLRPGNTGAQHAASQGGPSLPPLRSTLTPKVAQREHKICKHFI